jgi:hypothetical protein
MSIRIQRAKRVSSTGVGFVSEANTTACKCLCRNGPGVSGITPTSCILRALVR